MDEVTEHLTSYARNWSDLRPNVKRKVMWDRPPCGPPRGGEIF